MKKPLLVLALSLAAVSARAENVALDQAARLANGVPAAAMMDGARDTTVVADATPGGPAPARVVTTPARGDIAISGRTPAAPSRTASEPGFFSRTWTSIKKPGFLVPAGMALALGAGGAMVAGPLGAIAGALIGGLLGFIFSKALG